MDRKAKLKKINIQRKFLLLLIFLSTIFMSIGYSTINSISLNINGLAKSTKQEGIFITDYKYISDVNANLENSKIENIYQSNLKSDITLSNTDPNSSITYEITIYNSTDKVYYFNTVKQMVGEETYSNNNIIYKLEGIEHGDIIGASGSQYAYVTFKITFYYYDKNNITNNNLKSYLNFNFEDFFNIDYINIENIGNYPLKIVKGGTLSIILENVNNSEIIVKSGNNILIQNQDYTFDELTGTLTIPNITNNIIITKEVKQIKGYTVLEYISSDGNQYIDTGVKGKTGLQSDITLSFNNLVGNSTDDFGILGARTRINQNYEGNSSGYDRTYLLHYYNGFAHGYGMYYNSSIILENSKKYSIHSEINLGNQFVSVEGNKITQTNITREYDIGLNLYIFAINQDNSAHYPSSINLYHCRIYDNNVLIRDFIPVIRNSDKVKGLYDLVNNVFYENQGTGEFGSNEVEIESGYEYLTYIETTGTEYIDTEVPAKTGLKSDITLSVKEFTKNDFNILGARKNSDRIYLLHYYNGFTLGYGNYYTLSGEIKQNTIYNIQTDLSKSKQTLTFGESILTQNIETTYDLGLNLYLFALNENGTPTYYSPPIRLYNCKIYDGDVLVRNYQPVIRLKDNKIGLLDIENYIFYENKGTGTFNIPT